MPSVFTRVTRKVVQVDHHSPEESRQDAHDFDASRVIVLTTTGREGTFGRDRELAVLCRAVTGTAAGFGGCTIVTGSAGIGKSHLLRAALHGAAGHGVSVATRAAFELDRAAPLIT